MTLDVFHEEISPLNSGSFLKAYDMSDTYCTSQFGMVPKLVEEKPYVMHSPLTGASRVHALTGRSVQKKHQLKAKAEDADHTLTLDHS